MTVVEKGKLKGFLMSRCPIENFSSSNGHARAASGRQPVTRQSNLIVEISEPNTMEQLRKKLLKESKKQKKDFGYLFDTVEGALRLQEDIAEIHLM